MAEVRWDEKEFFRRAAGQGVSSTTKQALKTLLDLGGRDGVKTEFGTGTEEGTILVYVIGVPNVSPTKSILLGRTSGQIMLMFQYQADYPRAADALAAFARNTLRCSLGDDWRGTNKYVDADVWVPHVDALVQFVRSLASGDAFKPVLPKAPIIRRSAAKDLAAAEVSPTTREPSPEDADLEALGPRTSGGTEAVQTMVAQTRPGPAIPALPAEGVLRTMIEPLLQDTHQNAPESQSGKEPPAEPTAVPKTEPGLAISPPRFTGGAARPEQESHSPPEEEIDMEHVPRDPEKREAFFRRARQGQPRFRKELLRAYAGRCCVSGWSPDNVLEAAHIQGHAETGDNDITNGILLRSDLHALFDDHLLRIHPQTMTVVMHEGLRGTPYWMFHGKRLEEPKAGRRPSPEKLQVRWDNIE